MLARLPENKRLRMSDMERPTICVPPGLGDSYWSIVKVRAFAKREGLGIPYVGPVARPDNKFRGDVRALPFLERLPFLKSMGRSVDPGPANRNILIEGLSQVGRTAFPNIFGCDYFLSYNGQVANGKKLEEVDDLECEWFPEMTIHPEQEAYRAKCLAEYGDYMALFWPMYGFYSKWLAEFGPDKIRESMIRVARDTGLRPVFIGAIWDLVLPHNQPLTSIIHAVPNAVDLRGKTNLAEAFGLMQGAKIFIGHQAGIGMMSNVLGTKTLLVWNSCIHPDMPINCMPPTTVGKTYFVMDTKNMTVDNVVGKVKDILTI